MPRSRPFQFFLATLAAGSAAVLVLQSMHHAAGAPATRPIGIFSVVCTYTGQSDRIDPIVYPGQDAASHLHDFFGAEDVRSDSTGESLLGSPTSCTRPEDSAAYWAPALYASGRRLLPKHMKIYYQSYAETASRVQSFPVNFGMIVGNRKGTTPGELRKVWYSCASGDSSTTPPSTVPPASCPAGSDFQINLRFPSCWDGETLDGAAQTNVVYSNVETHACPASHPVTIPELKAHIHYTPVADMSDLTLAFTPTTRGSIYSAHADFLNAWNPPTLERLIAECLRVQAETRCGAQP